MYVNLLEEIRRIDARSRVLFTSYEFSQHFFERHVFPRFDGKALPLVLIDHQQYQHVLSSLTGPGLAESRYLLEPIELPHGVFHAKIVLACSDAKISLIMTSANLTPQGYAVNAELCTAVDILHEEKSHYPFLSDVEDFLKLLEPRISSNPHRQQIKRLREKCGFPTSLVTNSSTGFLHNMKKPILDQLREAVEEDVRQAFVVSPFFSQREKLYQHFSDLFGHTKLLVEVGNNNAPVNLLRSNRNFEFLSIFNKQNRPLHAKAIILETKSFSHCLSGSANFTESALLRTADEGNVEACFLRKERPSYFDYLFRGDFGTTHITPDQVKPVELPPERPETRPDLRILQATVGSQGLVLVLNRIPRGPVTVRIESTGTSYEISEPSTTIAIPISDEERGSLALSSVVTVESKSDEVTLSASRLIHSPQYAPLPQLVGIINEDERIWLFRVLNKLASLPSPSMLFAFLRRIEDEELFDKDPATREEILLRLKLRFEATTYSPEQELRDLIGRTISRHERRLQKWLTNPDPSTVAFAVESFLTLNKLILWAVCRSILNIDALRDIRVRMEDLEKTYASSISTFSSEVLRSLLPHLAVTAYLIDHLQSTSPEFKLASGERRNFLKDFFDETSLNAIFNVLRLCNCKLSLSRIKEALGEYSEFLPELKASAEAVVESLLRMIRSQAEIKHLYPLLEVEQ